ncbi:MAG: altronate dehydratase family protein [Oscillospiraceae bacterium]|nr:altronate dehydratase family protein [Oscillospiraceae bacterium]MDD4368677.1 altronate dehydratase family protein [Oscillospiraceae bacterium]
MHADTPGLIHIRPEDNVAVASQPFSRGTEVWLAGQSLTLTDDLPQGHKVALRAIAAGQPVIKYGAPIGLALTAIRPGQWVHTHNLRSGLNGQQTYEYRPRRQEPAAATAVRPRPLTFQGYRRPDGRVGIRNEIWILPLVGCVNSIGQRLAALLQPLAQRQGPDGIYCLTHPYGCSQLGDDLVYTQKILAALARHPNAGGVLFIGLGCENNTLESFKTVLGPYDPQRIRFMICQQESDEIQRGQAILQELLELAAADRRQPALLSELTVGLKCGGSDGLSGLTANPAVGAFSDLLIQQGGSSILTEVPEMFGAEQLLMQRCASREIFDQTVTMINQFKAYFLAHGQTVYENPSPGNKEGGISTLEDKSLGCVQKGGSSPVRGVIAYGQSRQRQGLNLLWSPGNDLVSTTALTAAGAQLILFTTGRGTPFGAPAVTLKIASNTDLAQRKPGWIDFDAGQITAGLSVQAAGQALLKLVVETADGKLSRAEINGCRDIAVFKDGVTL